MIFDFIVIYVFFFSRCFLVERLSTYYFSPSNFSHMEDEFAFKRIINGTNCVPKFRTFYFIFSSTTYHILNTPPKGQSDRSYKHFYICFKRHEGYIHKRYHIIIE